MLPRRQYRCRDTCQLDKRPAPLSVIRVAVTFANRVVNRSHPSFSLEPHSICVFISLCLASDRPTELCSLRSTSFLLVSICTYLHVYKRPQSSVRVSSQFPMDVAIFPVRTTVILLLSLQLYGSSNTLESLNYRSLHVVQATTFVIKPLFLLNTSQFAFFVRCLLDWRHLIVNREAAQ